MKLRILAQVLNEEGRVVAQRAETVPIDPKVMSAYSVLGESAGDQYKGVVIDAVMASVGVVSAKPSGRTNPQPGPGTPARAGVGPISMEGFSVLDEEASLATLNKVLGVKGGAQAPATAPRQDPYRGMTPSSLKPLPPLNIDPNASFPESDQ